MNTLTNALTDMNASDNNSSGEIIVETRKGLQRYANKIVGLSLVYNRKMYKHLASVDNADMFIELSIACKRTKEQQGIITLSPTMETVLVDTLTANDPIVYNVVIHTYTTGSMHTQAGLISGNGYTTVKLQVVRLNGIMAIGTIRKERFEVGFDNMSVAQLTLIKAMGLDTIAKHAEIQTGKHWNMLANGNQFDSKGDVFGNESNKHYLAHAKVKQAMSEAKKEAKRLAEQS